jgi:hypothetical protein
VEKLRSWISKAPRPERLRVRLEGGEERFIEFGDQSRNRWATAEKSVLAMGAESVEALDKKDTILRARKLTPDAEDEDLDEDEKEDRRRARAMSRERGEVSSLLREVLAEQKASFEAGAEAANTGQEHLVQLVDTLSQHLMHAITNLHNVSVNLSNMLQQQQADTGAPDNGALLEKVMGLAAARAMSSVASPNGPAAGGKKP